MSSIQTSTIEELYDRTSIALEEIIRIKDDCKKKNVPYEIAMKHAKKEKHLLDEYAFKFSSAMRTLEDYGNKSKLLKTVVGLDMAFGLVTTLLTYATDKNFLSAPVGFYVVSVPLIIWSYCGRKNAKKEFEKSFGKNITIYRERLSDLRDRLSFFYMEELFEGKK